MHSEHVRTRCTSLLLQFSENWRDFLGCDENHPEGVAGFHGFSSDGLLVDTLVALQHFRWASPVFAAAREFSLRVSRKCVI